MAELTTKPPKSLLEPLKNLSEKINNPALRYEISHLFLETGLESTHLETARKNIKDDDPMARISGLEVLSQLGTAKDISLLKKLADEEEDDEVLEIIGEVVLEINQRINAGKLGESK
ncbi:HEAT repeat domain-containing protein [Deltaproteobacteria bacterium TL4]